MLKRLFSLLIILFLMLSILTPFESYANKPQSYYNKFIELCDGQQWFIDYLEKELNISEKTLKKATGSEVFKNIRTIGLAEKEIKGKIPRAIGELTNLSYLYLGNNKLSGEIPDELYKLKYIEEIDLSGNQLNGKLSDKISNLNNLRVFIVWHNKLSGNIPENIGKLSNLENLDLAENNFSGNIPITLSNLTKLKLLALSNNNFKETDINQISVFGNLKNLRVLLLWNCNLKGSLPVSFSELPELQILDISENNLTGSIPLEYGSLPNLEKLALRYNNLTGIIPMEVGNLSKLHTLDLEANSIKGQIPESFSNLILLEKLVLRNNKLEHKIPNVFGNMLNLKLAYFDDNKFVSTVPDSLKARYDSGTYVSITKNYLTGANAKAINNNDSKNNDNFIDGSDTVPQHQMVLDSYLRLNKDEEKNIYNIFSTIEARNMGRYYKDKLPPASYEVTGVDNSAMPEGISVRVAEDGIFIKIDREVEFESALKLELRIKYNEGSNYSRTVFAVGTGEQPGGGGGGGGGGGTPSPAKHVYSHDKYLNGYKDSTVKPDGNIVREEISAVLYRITEDVNKENFSIRSNPYSDVESDRWSAAYIGFAKQKKIVTGYPDGSFRPANNITRGEFAAIICRYTKLDSNIDTSTDLTDISGHWSEGYVKAAFEKNYITGYADKTFKAESPITRAEAVTIVNRVLKRTPSKQDLLNKVNNPYKDLSTSHWAYEQILEASLNHKYTLGDDGLEIWVKE